MGNSLIMMGLVIAFIGVVMTVLQKTGVPRLPGDILVQKDNFTFYFPIATSILVSVVLTILFSIFRK
jgi:hypothetical protein